MTLRIIVRNSDWGYACNVGGPGTSATVTHKTFDIDAPTVEAFLKAAGQYDERAVVGVEVLAEDDPK